MSGAGDRQLWNMKLSHRRSSRRLAGLIAALGLACLTVSLGAVSPLAIADSTGQLQQQIGAGQGHVAALSGAVAAATTRMNALGTRISALQSQIAGIQGELDHKLTQLLTLRGQLTAARVRLVQLEAYERRAEAVLAQQLVGTYEAAPPDVVSVVLEATGFQNLLERISFAQRIRDQDKLIIGRVRAARSSVAAQATRLGGLEVRAQALATQVLNERNREYRAKVVLVDQQIAVARSRSGEAGQLATARDQLAALNRRLSALQAVQARQAQAAAAPQSPSSSVQSSGSGSQPVGSSPVTSSGGFTFPMPKGDVSPPGTWSLDDGVDISAPGGTPELAVCSGTVVLHGIGGFGPSAPVLHCDTPLSGYGYVYYGHAGPGNWTPVGTHVSAGAVISQVGYGIVGISTGPHLEIGFADSSGGPVGPASAPAMMSLLQASYGG
jgi:murein DD-endopeptidase MepM/ murein hydrolase activator NlpD